MKQLREKIRAFDLKEIISTATFRQSGITFVGTVANGVLSAVFYILAARLLGPANFGLLIVAIATLTLIADIGNLGTDTGLVRFIGKYLGKNSEKVLRFLKLGVEIKIGVWLFVLALGWILAPVLSGVIFSKPELTFPLRITFIGVGSYLLYSFIISALQGFQKFWAWSGFQIGASGVRVLVVLILFAYSKLNLETTLAVFVSVPLLAFLVGLFLLPVNFFKVKKETSVAKEFFQYNKWVAAFTAVAALGARLDTFISARLLTTAEVGIYGAAHKMAAIVPQLVGALGTVIAPKMAGMGEMKDFISYLKKTQLLVLGISVLGVLSIPVVLFFIPILFGSEYAASGQLFVVLLFAMLIFLISVPVHIAVIYYFSYPKLFLWISLGHLAIIAGVGWILISSFGVNGAAFTVLIGNLFNFVVPALWVLSKIKSKSLENFDSKT